MTVAVSNTARIVVKIDELCRASQALHAAGLASDGGEPLTFARFVDILSIRCDHQEAREVRDRLWATLADLAGVLDPNARVRRQVLDYLASKENAA